MQNGGLRRVPLEEVSTEIQSAKRKLFFINLLRACLAEFFGTAIFIFNGAMSSGDKIYGSFGHGFTIVILAFTFAHISGAHFNPAITFGQLVCGTIHYTKAALYIFFQLLGGFVGALFLRAVTIPDGCPVSYTMTAPNGCLSIAGGVIIPLAPWQQALAMETILTFILMMVVLCTDVDTQNEKTENVLAPLAIGFTLFVNILAGRHISGASMNPARSFGPAAAYSIFVPGSTGQWTYHYIYWAGPVAGATLAALFYKLIIGSFPYRWHFKRSATKNQ